MSSSRITYAGIALSTALTGCSDHAISSASAVYRQTIVQLNGENAPTVTIRTLTEEEQRAEAAARERLTHQDPGVLREAIGQDKG
jgi:hypothetical protein